VDNRTGQLLVPPCQHNTSIGGVAVTSFVGVPVCPFCERDHHVAEIARLDSALAKVTAERDAARAEVERMKPVVAAAIEYVGPLGEDCSDLDTAVETYLAADLTEPPSKRKPLTECVAVFTRYGTSVKWTHHHDGCALDMGKGECNCDPIRTSDRHTPRDAAEPKEGK